MRRTSLWLAALLFALEAWANKTEIVSFDEGWQFFDRQADAYAMISLPHDATVELPRERLEGYGEQGYVKGGVFRYRKLICEPLAKNARHSVRFDGVYMDSSVYVNGRLAGGRHNGYLPFEIELDHTAPTNLIEVVVRAETPNSRWNSGAGIMRHAWLVHRRGWTLEPERVAIRTERADARCARLRVKVEDAAVVEPANGILEIENPRWWSPESPELYDIRVVARNANGETDELTIPYGIRTIEFTKDDGMHLNGRRYQIKGVCQHEGSPCFGPRLDDVALEWSLLELKKLGVNAIRTTHNPFPPEFYRLCDRLGFLVKNEIFDEWREPKSPMGYSRFFDSDWRADLETCVRRDRNHPCVIMWSIGNEIPEICQCAKKHPERIATAAKQAAEMRDLLHALDPTRPVTAGINGAKKSAANGVCDVLDIVGLNYNDDCYRLFKGKYALFGSETAATYSLRDTYHFRDDGKGGLTIVKSTNFLASAYSSIPYWGVPNMDQELTLLTQVNSPWSAGEFTWCSFDYLGEGSHAECNSFDFWPAVGSCWGMFDFAGLRKDRAYLYQSVWSSVPVAHLLPDWTLTGFEGKRVPVWCYTNGDEAELFLNGVSMGVRRRADTQALHLEWSIPYSPGELKVVARRDGAVVASDVRRTAGAFATIKETVLFRRGNRVLVRFDAVDVAGNRVVNCDAEFTIPNHYGELLAAANGSPLETTSHRSPRRRLFRGSATAWFATR